MVNVVIVRIMGRAEDRTFGNFCIIILNKLTKNINWIFQYLERNFWFLLTHILHILCILLRVICFGGNLAQLKLIWKFGDYTFFTIIIFKIALKIFVWRWKKIARKISLLCESNAKFKIWTPLSESGCLKKTFSKFYSHVFQKNSQSVLFNTLSQLSQLIVHTI